MRRDGRVASTVDGSDAAIRVELREDGAVELQTRNFRILKSEAEAVRACSDVQGTLSSTCDDAPMSKEDTEWSWLIEIEGVNSEGTYTNLKRSRFVFDLDDHSYMFPRVRAGEYTVTFHEVDVWSSWARRDNLNASYEDSVRLLERYATGRSHSETVEIGEEEIAAGKYTNLFHIDLISEVCL